MAQQQGANSRPNEGEDLVTIQTEIPTMVSIPCGYLGLGLYKSDSSRKMTLGPQTIRRPG